MVLKTCSNRDLLRESWRGERPLYECNRSWTSISWILSHVERSSSTRSEVGVSSVLYACGAVKNTHPTETSRVQTKTALTNPLSFVPCLGQELPRQRREPVGPWTLRQALRGGGGRVVESLSMNEIPSTGDAKRRLVGVAETPPSHQQNGVSRVTTEPALGGWGRTRRSGKPPRI